MKSTLSLHQRAETLKEAHLTGELRNNSRSINEQAVRELLARNPYWGLKLKAVRELDLEYDDAIQQLAKACGIDVETFLSHDKAYIDPETTVKAWDRALKLLDSAAEAKATVLFATGHPGSLLETYRLLAERAREGGAVIVDRVERLKTPSRRYLDTVGGVVVMSDEGSLLHTHDDEGLIEVIRHYKPDLVLADHGFAAAAINEEVPTIAIFDSDDPGLPLAASLSDDILAVPMNDNQTNLLTAKAVMTVLGISD
jgi:hypothetical protein